MSSILGTIRSILTGGWFQKTDVSTTSADYNTYTDLPENNPFIATFGHENEQELYALLETEAFNKHGVALVYYQSTYDVNYNRIFGEDNNRRYTRKFNIMVYYQPPKELELWSKFGIEGLDNFQVFMSKRHFRQACAADSNSYLKPKAGDVVQAGYNGRFYEIIDVCEEEEMFLQKKHSWIMTLQVFRDEHVIMTEPLSADTLADYTNRSSDIFDVSATIDQKKPTILYQNQTGETAPNNIWGSW